MIRIEKYNNDHVYTIIKEAQKRYDNLDDKDTLSPSDIYDKVLKPSSPDDEKGYTLRRNLRSILIKEQGHLCAYCCCPIAEPIPGKKDSELGHVTIEHYYPLSKLPDSKKTDAFDYLNLLAVCGHRYLEDKLKEDELGLYEPLPQFCEHKRGNSILVIDPSNYYCIDMKEHEKMMDTIFYDLDGNIHSKDEKIDKDLKQTLNLNVREGSYSLPDERKAVLLKIQERIKEHIQEWHQTDRSHGDFQDKSKAQTAKTSPIDYIRELLKFYEDKELNNPKCEYKTPHIGFIIWYLKHLLEIIGRGGVSADEYKMALSELMTDKTNQISKKGE